MIEVKKTGEIPGKNHYVIATDGDVAGFGHAHIAIPEDNPRHCLLWFIFILPEVRCQGIGSIIIDALKNEYDVIETRVDSEMGLEFILKNGFKTPNGIVYFWVKEGVNATNRKR